MCESPFSTHKKTKIMKVIIVTKSNNYDILNLKDLKVKNKRLFF